MSDVKQVKVANWGIYFLQRLKHFFNRTDYCDLTLQFQDNAQLKVHRLVLSACTEYFELLERTCEMYEDCLVMPDDLQADVVVPIVNFMYTGQLEFRMELLERLYQTSLVLNLPVLSKLLESHRLELNRPTSIPNHSYSAVKKFPKHSESTKIHKSSTSMTISNKRSYSKAFDTNTGFKEKKAYYPLNKSDNLHTSNSYMSVPSVSEPLSCRKILSADPRPSRYELPEELDQDNIFDNSFCNISYTSKPLMVHPETLKRYSSTKNRTFNNPSSSRKFSSGVSTVDIVECKRITKEDNIYDDRLSMDHSINDEMFPVSLMNLQDETPKDSSQLFDQILNQESPKVTIESKDNTLPSNIDHAKIISEVLKKYPHLVKGNKNIKLKILNTQDTKAAKQQKPSYVETKRTKLKTEGDRGYSYESDVLDSKEAAKLIALGADNVKGPWICLICGTPGKALHFTSYYKFRRHLIEVHNEKPVSNMCEYCGLKSLKRNYLLHHLYSQHGVEPPPQYHFPKCNKCNYIALTEGFLVKHKMTHILRNFRCNVCAMAFNTSYQLLAHIQNTGHKYSSERKTNLQCIYCLKVFLRETNLYAHLKTHHKKEAKYDGVIEDSDEEKMADMKQIIKSDNDSMDNMKYETGESEYEVDVQFQIQQKTDGDIQIVSRKQHNVNVNQKQKILNSGFGSTKPVLNTKPLRNQSERNDFLEDDTIQSPNYEEVIIIDNEEYIMKDNQLIPRKEKLTSKDYILSNMIEPETLQNMQPAGSIDFNNQNDVNENLQQASVVIKKSAKLNQPIQIVVSNEEEYKALMASNHPIIFDNSGTNKTIMLSAPHDTTLESTHIDDKTQSNDMMIIPDYPLNVPETVSTDNPNIVVVYSHPLHDENKQYQIITTQGAQFIQSSAIITQNYETITTSTPVMSANVLDTNIEETWQNNVQALVPQQMQLESEPELNSVIETDTMDITPIENEASNNIEEGNLNTPLKEYSAQLPQVDQNKNQSPIDEIHLSNNRPPTENINPTVGDIVHMNDDTLTNIANDDTLTNIANVNTSETQDQSQVYETSESQEMSESQESVIHPDSIVTSVTMQAELMKIDDKSKNVIENEVNAFVPISTEIMYSVESNSVISSVDTNHENSENIQNQMEIENEVNGNLKEASLQQDIADTVIEIPTTDITINPETTLNPVMHSKPADTDSPTYAEMVEITLDPNKEIPCNKESKNEIQNLALEWSEDEYDSIPEETNQQVEIVPIQTEEPQHQSKSLESEETIENIQLEMEKQISTIKTKTVVNDEERDNSVQEEMTISSIKPKQCDVINTTDIVAMETDPKEKISSLLNDWEDNDSQEENGSTNDYHKENYSNNESVAKSDLDSAQQEQPDINTDPKNENIKKLVSDWDDEDDEIKE